jgi:F0F1-type ATP synthase membrane subunit b/b'
MGQLLALLSQLGVNQSFFVMFGLFATTYLLVSFLLTGPVASLLVERDKRIAGRQKQITKIRSELLEIQETLSSKRRLAQQEASSKFETLKLQASIQQRKILTEAREDFAKQVKTAREKVEKMLIDEKQKLDLLSVELTQEILKKLLGSSSAKKVTLEKEF